MKNIEIIITKQEINEKVSINSSYTGAKTTDDKALFEKIAAIDADSDLINGFTDDVFGIILHELQGYVYDAAMTETRLMLTLQVSGAYDNALTDSMQKDILSAISAGVTARWFAISYPEKASEWTDLSSGLISRAIAKLCHRKKPVRGA